VDWVTTLGGDRVGRLLDAVPDPTLVVDDSGVVRFANGEATRVFGWPRQELLGRSLRELVPDWDADKPQPTGRGQSLSHALARHRNGRTVPVDLTLAPIEESTGFVAVFLHDVSSRIQLEQEAERTRDELIANISHELRTPLTSIVGYLELISELGEDEVGPQARRLVEIVARNAVRELRLVNDLLAVSFVDDYLARTSLEQVDLGVLVGQVVEEQQLFAHGAGLTLRLQAEDSVMVRGDSDRLVRLLENLVVNSCKFTPPGGEIRVTVAGDGPNAVLTVADTGIGVSAAERERIFERMYRAPGAIDRQVEGAGLGLSIAKAIVEAHSGTITVDSTPGLGTTVQVALPRSEPRL